MRGECKLPRGSPCRKEPGPGDSHPRSRGCTALQTDPGLHCQRPLWRRGLGNSFLGMPSCSLVLGSVMVGRESTWRGDSY